MTLYHFAVHNGPVRDDPEGTELPDDASACVSALEVIRDLKNNNEAKWIGWTMEVTDGDRHVANPIHRGAVIAMPAICFKFSPRTTKFGIPRSQ